VDRGFDLLLRVVGQLHPVRAEELQPVVLVRVVRRRHHARQVEAEAPREQRRAGCRQHAAHEGVAAGGGDPRRQRGLEHLARLARVAHDQHLRNAARRQSRGRAPERQREVGGQELADDAANAVGAEQPAARMDRAHGGG
jgi:hypothetical protein